MVQPWDHARYVNHSCDPNCGGTDHCFEVALRDIAPGEQITEDYDGYSLPNEPPFLCVCGARDCRGLNAARASASARESLARKVQAALRDVSHVAQPLADLINPWPFD